MKIPRIYAKKPNGWSPWIRPVMKGYRMGCCDCHLVHEFQFRVTKKGHVEFRAKRDEKHTAKERYVRPIAPTDGSLWPRSEIRRPTTPGATDE